jgi:hypothetical protein
MDQEIGFGSSSNRRCEQLQTRLPLIAGRITRFCFRSEANRE